MLTDHLTNVIIALIAGICSFGGSWLASNKQMALMSYRLEQLEKRFDDSEISERLLKLEMWKDEQNKREK